MISFRFQILFILLTLMVVSATYSQEVVSGLEFNQEKNKVNAVIHHKSGNVANSSLTLPFFDDFSNTRVYPDQSKWMDNFVFVNKDFPVFPTNAGAATFDVIDQKGWIYEHASSVPFVADYLTSKFIRLDSTFTPAPKKLTPADSVYLSFYFQPQGRGNSPEPKDSIVLQLGYPTGRMVFDYVDSITIPVDFILIANGIENILPLDKVYAPDGCDTLFLISNRIYTWGDDITLPCDTVFKPEVLWTSVWSEEGSTLESFIQKNGVHFKQVLIPITDTLYFSRDFQFRFFNYGSLVDNVNPGARGNVDQWSIDFVYLNHNRSYNDIFFEKIGFSERAPSFLKRYESMPYRQYRAAPTVAVKPELEMRITNLSQNTRNTKYRYIVEQVEGDQLFGWDGGNCNLASFSISGFQTCATGCGAKHACPPIASLFALDFDLDTTSFYIRHFVSDSSGSNILVDSVVYRQGFYNYFSYDDGTPEGGYGLEPAFGYLAQQYTLSVSDTLKSIQILFNKTINNGNDKRFDLIVWSDLNGQPGEVVYRKRNLRPLWSEELFGFYTYFLDEPVILNGNFYIGLQQQESGSLNIGFDAVNNSKQYLFFNTSGVWQNSIYDGSLMMRPVFGSGIVIGIDESDVSIPEITHFPNPTNGLVRFRIAENSNFIPDLIQLYDLTGRVVFGNAYEEQIDISHLPAGFYLLRITSQNNLTYTSRIMISK
jgi:hypothetical protein